MGYMGKKKDLKTKTSFGRDNFVDNEAESAQTKAVEAVEHGLPSRAPCPFNSSVVTLNVGPKKTLFRVHESVLSQSGFLLARMGEQIETDWGMQRPSEQVRVENTDPRLFELVLCHMYGIDYGKYESETRPTSLDNEDNNTKLEIYISMYCVASKLEVASATESVKNKILTLQTVHYETLLTSAQTAYAELGQDDSWFADYFKGQTRETVQQNRDLMREPWIHEAFGSGNGKFTQDLFATITEHAVYHPPVPELISEVSAFQTRDDVVNAISDDDAPPMTDPSPVEAPTPDSPFAIVNEEGSVFADLAIRISQEPCPPPAIPTEESVDREVQNEPECPAECSCRERSKQITASPLAAQSPEQPALEDSWGFFPKKDKKKKKQALDFSQSSKAEPFTAESCDDKTIQASPIPYNALDVLVEIPEAPIDDIWSAWGTLSEKPKKKGKLVAMPEVQVNAEEVFGATEARAVPRPENTEIVTQTEPVAVNDEDIQIWEFGSKSKMNQKKQQSSWEVIEEPVFEVTAPVEEDMVSIDQKYPEDTIDQKKGSMGFLELPVQEDEPVLTDEWALPSKKSKKDKKKKARFYDDDEEEEALRPSEPSFLPVEDPKEPSTVDAAAVAVDEDAWSSFGLPPSFKDKKKKQKKKRYYADREEHLNDLEIQPAPVETHDITVTAAASDKGEEEDSIWGIWGHPTKDKKKKKKTTTTTSNHEDRSWSFGRPTPVTTVTTQEQQQHDLASFGQAAQEAVPVFAIVEEKAEKEEVKHDIVARNAHENACIQRNFHLHFSGWSTCSDCRAEVAKAAISAGLELGIVE